MYNWMWVKGIPMNSPESNLRTAVIYGDTKMIETLSTETAKSKACFIEKGVYYAILYSKSELALWMIDKGCKIDNKCYEFAVKSGLHSVIKAIFELAKECVHEISDYPAYSISEKNEQDHIKTCELLTQNGIPIYSYMAWQAYRKECVSLIVHLWENHRKTQIWHVSRLAELSTSRRYNEIIDKTSVHPFKKDNWHLYNGY